MPREGYASSATARGSKGLFARIERWTQPDRPSDTFWRSISRDNVTTLYGRTANSRIADPADPTPHLLLADLRELRRQGQRASVYDYKAEDDDRRRSRRRRTSATASTDPSANRYLKRIRYGNRGLAPRPRPRPGSGRRGCSRSSSTTASTTRDGPDARRPRRAGRAGSDPFSTYRAGFEVRTYRLCRRVLDVPPLPRRGHRQRLPGQRRRDFALPRARDRSATVVHRVGDADRLQARDRPAPPYLPEVAAAARVRVHASRDRTITCTRSTADSLENLPVGLDGRSYQWVDLDGEGVSGVLTEQADAWFYKRNLSPISTLTEDGAARPARPSRPWSSLRQARLRRDRRADAAVSRPRRRRPARPRALRRPDCRASSSARPKAPGTTSCRFASLPNSTGDDPNLRFVDLTGDGHADVLITEDRGFTWHPSLGEAASARRADVPGRSTTSAVRGWCSPTASKSIYLADMSGDGLTDLVRIRNGEVCYWPNLGYGRFGAKVTMDDAPWFDAPDQFVAAARSPGRHRRLRPDRHHLPRPRRRHRLLQPVRQQLERAGRPLTAVPASRRPHGRARRRSARQRHRLPGVVLAAAGRRAPADALHRSDGRTEAAPADRAVNNLGAETLRRTTPPSTKFYLADKAAGKPWITRLPFPVHVVEKVDGHGPVAQHDASPALQLPPRLLRRRRARVPRLRPRRAGRRRDVRHVRCRQRDSPYITTDQTLYQPPVKTDHLVPHRRGARSRAHPHAVRRRSTSRARSRSCRTPSRSTRLRREAASRARPRIRGPDRRRMARGAARLQGHDAAAGDVRARRRRAGDDGRASPGAAVLDRYAQLRHPAPAARGHQPARGLPGHRERSAQLSLRAGPAARRTAVVIAACADPDPRIAHTLNLRFDEHRQRRAIRRRGLPRAHARTATMRSTTGSSG